MTDPRNPRRNALLSIAASATWMLHPRVFAQGPAWPDKPIRLVVPSATGGAADFVGRTFGRFLEQRISQPVIIENKPGAGGIIGAETVKNAAPDGSTFLLSGSSTQAANASLYRKLPYDPAKDFAEIGIFGLFPNIAVVKPGSPLTSIEEIIRQARVRPNGVTYGYYSSSSQVPPALIQSRAQVELVGASYKNITQIITDIAAGVIDFAFLDALSAAPALSGLLTPIAVTSPDPFPNLPGVPTVSRTLPGFEVQSWLGLSAPAATPAGIVDRMNAFVRAATLDATLQAALLKQGMTVRQSTAAEHSAFAAAERERWAEWVRLAKITPQ